MKINYNNRIFKPVSSSANGEVTNETHFLYKQTKNIITATYKGGLIEIGQLLGKVDEFGNIEMCYHQINNKGEFMTGKCSSRPEILENGKLRLLETWEWTSGDFSKGTSILEEC